VISVLDRPGVIDTLRMSIGSAVTTSTTVQDVFISVLVQRDPGVRGEDPDIQDFWIEDIEDYDYEAYEDALADIDDAYRRSTNPRVVIQLHNSRGDSVHEEIDVSRMYDFEKRLAPSLKEAVYDPVHGHLAIVATPHPIVVFEIAEALRTPGSNPVRASARLWPVERDRGQHLTHMDRAGLFQVLVAYSATSSEGLILPSELLFEIAQHM